MHQSSRAGRDLKETARKRVLGVAYWCFFANAFLVACDMVFFIRRGSCGAYAAERDKLAFRPFPFQHQSVCAW